LGAVFRRRDWHRLARAADQILWRQDDAQVAAVKIAEASLGLEWG
jgi:hypothetical protein